MRIAKSLVVTVIKSCLNHLSHSINGINNNVVAAHHWIRASLVRTVCMLHHMAAPAPPKKVTKRMRAGLHYWHQHQAYYA
jgi:hypothetical protein